MNKKYMITIVFMAAIVITIFAADFVFAYFWGEPGTISARMWVLCKQWPLVPFATGVVMGHLFWQSRQKYGPED